MLDIPHSTGQMTHVSEIADVYATVTLSFQPKAVPPIAVVFAPLAQAYTNAIHSLKP